MLCTPPPHIHTRPPCGWSHSLPPFAVALRADPTTPQESAALSPLALVNCVGRDPRGDWPVPPHALCPGREDVPLVVGESPTSLPHACGRPRPHRSLEQLSGETCSAGTVGAILTPVGICEALAGIKVSL